MNRSKRKVFKRKVFSLTSTIWREYTMSAKISKKAEVLAAILIVLFSAIVVAGTVHALEPQKGTIDFVLLYDDVESGDSYYLSDVSAYLYDMDGHFIDVSNSTSNGIVEFTNVVYGNYVVKVNAVSKGMYVYKSASAVIRLDQSGLKKIDGSAFTSLTVERYPLSHVLNLTITKGGLPIVADVSMYFDGCQFAEMNVFGNQTFNVTQGTVTVKVAYNEGGVEKDYYKDVEIAASDTHKNVSIDLDNYYRILGTVRDSSKIVNTTTHIVVLNKTTGDVWNVLTFNGGAFSFYLPSLNYKLVITADGYSIVEQDATTSEISAAVTKVTNNVNADISLSSDLTWVNVSYTIDISNKSVIYGLPYSDTGILYYQMKLLGWSNTDLVNYLKNKYYDYTTDIITLDNEIYSLDHVNSQVTPVDSANERYTLQINAYYHNGDVKKSKMLEDGVVNVALYGKMDHIEGASIVYAYKLNIPSYLERSNDVQGATVSGYVNQISVSEIKTNVVQIDLKERKSPAITLDNEHFVIGWANMTNVNHIVNQSADNYTVVIPAYKAVWFNASKMVYDVVRDKMDADNTTYTWLVDGSQVSSGVAHYNITRSLARGKHILTIKVADVGGNTNETNVTLLADNIWPTVNITITDPSGKVLAKLWTDNSSIARIDYNVTGTTGHAWRNGTTYLVKIGPKLVINESQEIVYDASSSYDTYDTVNKTNLPVIVEWNFNGNKSTGDNRSYAFDVPSRKGNYYVNVTLTDSVNNTIIISLPVEVKDITKPVVKLNFTVNGKNVNEVKEEENVTLDATGSYDPENGTIASYNWTIKDENYKVINVTDGIYDIVNGSFASGNVTLKFHKYGTYYIILNVTDGAGNYNVVNKTLRVTPVRPDLTLNSVDIKGDRVEGNKLSFVVNVSNNGDTVATTYWIAIYVNGKVAANQTFHNLKNGTYAVQTMYWTPPAPGNYTIKVKVGCATEPPSYTSDNSKTMTVKVEQAPWKMPAIIGGSIAIIAIGGYIGWRYMQKKGEKKKFKKKSKGEKKEKK